MCRFRYAFQNVCWFVWSLSSHSRIFHSYGDVTISVEVLQILTQHSWPLSSEGSLACHTYCDTCHLLWHSASVFNGNLRGPVTLTLVAERLAGELSPLGFTTTWICRSWDLNTKTSACKANALTAPPWRSWEEDFVGIFIFYWILLKYIEW